MPKRSDRDLFPDAFISTPFRGLSGSGAYRKLRWGNAPQQRWNLEAPERDLVSLGELARLDVGDETERYPEGSAPFLVVGLKSNLLYIVPRDDDGNPVDIGDEHGATHYLGRAKRTDYLSEKGGDETVLFYHQHERPYPRVYENPRTGVRVLIPDDHDGQPSYAVIPEGIVG